MGVVKTHSFDDAAPYDWDTLSGGSVTTGRHGNGYTNGAGDVMQDNVATNVITIGAAWFSNPVTNFIHEFRDGPGRIIFGIGCATDGRFYAQLTTQVGSGTSPWSSAYVDSQQWYYVESSNTLSVSIVDNGDGTSHVIISCDFEVHINSPGTPGPYFTVLSGTLGPYSGNIANTQLPGVVWNEFRLHATFGVVDDVVVRDDGTFTGDCYVHSDGSIEIVAGVVPEMTQVVSEIGESPAGDTEVTQELSEVGELPPNDLEMTQVLCEVAIGLRGISYATMRGRARGISPTGGMSVGIGG